jgi:hypothetical protein
LRGKRDKGVYSHRSQKSGRLSCSARYNPLGRENLRGIHNRYGHSEQRLSVVENVVTTRQNATLAWGLVSFYAQTRDRCLIISRSRAFLHMAVCRIRWCFPDCSAPPKSAWRAEFHNRYGALLPLRMAHGGIRLDQPTPVSLAISLHANRCTSSLLRIMPRGDECPVLGRSTP